MVRRSHLVGLAAAGLVVWVARWALLEVASYLHRTRPSRGPLPREAEHAPGHMPGPLD